MVLAFCLVLLVAGVVLIVALFAAPCSWLDWMPVTDIPVRCLR